MYEAVGECLSVSYAKSVAYDSAAGSAMVRYVAGKKRNYVASDSGKEWAAEGVVCVASKSAELDAAGASSGASGSGYAVYGSYDVA